MPSSFHARITFLLVHHLRDLMFTWRMLAPRPIHPSPDTCGVKQDADPKVLVDDPPLMAEIDSLFSRTKQIADEKVGLMESCTLNLSLVPFLTSFRTLPRILSATWRSERRYYGSKMLDVQDVNLLERAGVEKLAATFAFETLSPHKVHIICAIITFSRLSDVETTCGTLSFIIACPSFIESNSTHSYMKTQMTFSRNRIGKVWGRARVGLFFCKHLLTENHLVVDIIQAFIPYQ